jgi:hypothetical protein
MATICVGIDLAQERFRQGATRQAEEFDVAYGLVFFAGLNAFCYMQLPEFFRLSGTGKSLLFARPQSGAHCKYGVSSLICGLSSPLDGSME